MILGSSDPGKSALSPTRKLTVTPVLVVIVTVLREKAERNALVRSYDARKVSRSKEDDRVPEQIGRVVPLGVVGLWRHQRTSVHFLYFPTRIQLSRSDWSDFASKMAAGIPHQLCPCATQL